MYSTISINDRNNNYNFTFPTDKNNSDSRLQTSAGFVC